jgi:hypothetical protein
MRTRKPCVRLRLTTDGWYVRLVAMGRSTFQVLRLRRRGRAEAARTQAKKPAIRRDQTACRQTRRRGQAPAGSLRGPADGPQRAQIHPPTLFHTLSPGHPHVHSSYPRLVHRLVRSEEILALTNLRQPQICKRSLSRRGNPNSTPPIAHRLRSRHVSCG